VRPSSSRPFPATPHDKSAYTQAHGVSRNGIVTSVTNSGGRTRFSEVAVRLDAQATTTAHVEPVTSLKPGATVRVLVDPQDPGYAEFPGQPFSPTFPVLVTVLIIVGLLAIAGFVAPRFGLAWLRQRRK
jgi:hypothetical protein